MELTLALMASEATTRILGVLGFLVLLPLLFLAVGSVRATDGRETPRAGVRQGGQAATTTTGCNAPSAAAAERSTPPR